MTPLQLELGRLFQRLVTQLLNMLFSWASMREGLLQPPVVPTETVLRIMEKFCMIMIGFAVAIEVLVDFLDR